MQPFCSVFAVWVACCLVKVRTNDDVTIKVKLMLFYELRDMETMLNTTHDPVADFINAVCSDVITFTATMSYEEFLKRTHKLSELQTYSQLVQRSSRIGFDITKVNSGKW